jgi:hypothetical protein
MRSSWDANSDRDEAAGGGACKCAGAFGGWTSLPAGTISTMVLNSKNGPAGRRMAGRVE